MLSFYFNPGSAPLHISPKICQIHKNYVSYKKKALQIGTVVFCTVCRVMTITNGAGSNYKEHTALQIYGANYILTLWVHYNFTIKHRKT